MNIELFKCVHGSRLYGTDTPNSDIDYKGVFIPNIDDVMLGRAPSEIRSSTGKPHEKNTKDDVDSVMYSLSKFIDMACDGHMVAIDILHAHSSKESVLHTSDIWNEIVRKRERFYTSDMRAFVSYARKQAAKYGIKGSRIAVLEKILDVTADVPLGKYKLVDIIDTLPTTEFSGIINKDDGSIFYHVFGKLYQDSILVDEFVKLMFAKYREFGSRAQEARTNEGIDWKAISHALRASYQLNEIYTTGDLKFPLRTRQYLLDVKLGKLDFTKEVQPELERTIERTNTLALKSGLPKKVDKSFWDSFLLKCYKG